MKIIPHPQGSPGWHTARAWPRHPASEAAAAMGVSPYITRTELLRQKATGDVPGIDAATQARFDRGHASEAAARVILEAELGEDLFPMTATDDDGYLLASSDGVTIDGRTGFEHKDWSEERAAAVRAGELLPGDWPQCEVNIRVFELDKIIFVVSDGTKDRRVMLEYRAVPGRIEQVMAAWRQFDADLAEYQHVEVIPAAVAAPTMALPALSIQVNGSISLIDNLALFGAKLKEFVGSVNKTPDNDQDFANLEQAVKTLKTAEDALEAAESNALAQTASIDEMRRTVGMYKDLARTNRLLFNKIVEAEKSNIRATILASGVDSLKAHIAGLNTRIGKPYMPAVPADFAGAMKGKKTIASLRSAVADELARAKIAANEAADRIQINVKLLSEQYPAYAFLFADAGAIVLKANDDFAALVKMRIAEHEAAEFAKAEALREKIRAEEVSKIEAQRIADSAKAAPIESVAPRENTPAGDWPRQPAAAADPRTAPPPIPVPIAWGLEKRPTDYAIIDVLMQHYGVPGYVVLDWLLAMDLGESRKRFAQ